MKLTRYEQETIISYNEEEKVASVYTHNVALQRRLAALAAERPDECKLIRSCQDGDAMEYEVPKRWVKIRANRILTEEQLQKARERAAAMLAGRKADEDTESEPDDIDEDDDFDDDEEKENEE